MDRDAREPRPTAASQLRLGVGSDIPYPPPRDRFATVRRNCAHCGLPADTNARSCPVCGARYPPLTRRGRLAARLRDRARRPSAAGRASSAGPPRG